MSKFRALNPRIKILLLVLIAGFAISLNFFVLWQALPETQRIDSGCCAPQSSLLAKDFSAFYFAAWNMFHNPSAIYAPGSSVKASFLGISPHPETFKYLPSFILLAAPFLFLSYNQAFYAFDAVQFAMLILIAFLIYELLSLKNIAVIGIVLVLALLLPFSTVASWGVSEAYFWQWAEGQSKVLQLALILLGLYFGSKKKPVLSGIFYGLSFFDAELAIFALPLFFTLNREKVGRAGIVTVLTLVVTNAPIFAIPGVAPVFVQTLLSTGASTPLRPYSLIPLVAIVALSCAMWKEMASAFSALGKHDNALVKVDDKKIEPV